MDELKALRSLAHLLGAHTRYSDGLERPVTVTPETLLAVCAAMGAPVSHPGDAVDVLRFHRAEEEAAFLPPVLVAWGGTLPSLPLPGSTSHHAALTLEDGTSFPLVVAHAHVRAPEALPLGYHRLTMEASGRTETCTVIAAPVEAWHPPGSRPRWGLGVHLAALRSARSRSLGDLRDLESFCHWVGAGGGSLVATLPLLPTFNSNPAEPSPYSPVSRLFWSELVLDLGGAHQPTGPVTTLDVTRADAEVRRALEGLPLPDPSLLDGELVRYASFRGAQARLGRNWRDWPPEARSGELEPQQVDGVEERFHLVAQAMVRRQLVDLRQRMAEQGVGLGLDLAVGTHPDGYDPWSRQELFGNGVSVGAPPDKVFPSGQDWGFAPVLPGASRREGHRYLAASIAHQAALAGVLRIDHIMACTRLYWIPHGFGLHQGTYVSYPAEELFAVITLESHRNQCEVVGENLGTVPPEIDEALPRHRIWGTYLALFHAADPVAPKGPTPAEMAQVGTHDTPTFAGWIRETDIDERLRCGLLAQDAESEVREERVAAVATLAAHLGASSDEPEAFLAALLGWLGQSDSPLIVPWLEDLWLEDEGVNLPGTPSSARPNWQRPMARLLDDVFADPELNRLIHRLHRPRNLE